jgi:hypothetical protein
MPALPAVDGSPMTADQDPNLDLPPALQQALREGFGRTPAVPADLDRLITAQARAHLARRARWRLVVRLGSAVAAAVAVGALVWLPLASRPSRVSALAGDVNTDGRVDMLDAYLMARALCDQRSADGRWDLNGDKVIDQRDVDALAARAVSLGGKVQ